MAKPVLSREEKGRLIAENATQIMAMDESHFKVASHSRDVCYDVVRRENRSWICSCFDHCYRQVRCKHIIACQIREQLREKVRENVIIRPVGLLLASTANQSNSRNSALDTISTETFNGSYASVARELSALTLVSSA